MMCVARDGSVEEWAADTDELAGLLECHSLASLTVACWEDKDLCFRCEVEEEEESNGLCTSNSSARREHRFFRD